VTELLIADDRRTPGNGIHPNGEYTLDEFSLAPVTNLRGQLCDHHVSVYVGRAQSVQSTNDGRPWNGVLQDGDVAIAPNGLSFDVTWVKPATFLALTARRLFEQTADEIGVLGHLELRFEPQIHDRQLQGLMLGLREHENAGRINGRVYGDLLAHALALHVVKQYSVRACHVRESRGGLDRIALARVLDYIEAHLSENVTLAHLAATANLGPHYFCQLFKQSTGRTPHQFLTARRISHARHLLRRTRLALADVALATGFSSQAHFTDVFRRLTNVTPRQYRHASMSR